MPHNVADDLLNTSTSYDDLVKGEKNLQAATNGILKSGLT